jgi:hypothetical protein
MTRGINRRCCASVALALAAGLCACASDSGPTGVPQDTTKPPVTADTMPLRHYAQARGRWIGAATGTVPSPASPHWG